MEHVGGLAVLGMAVARQISRGCDDAPSSIYKVANAIWSGMCSVWSSMCPEVREACDVKGTTGSSLETCRGLVACMESCLDSVRDHTVDPETGSKVLKFLVSNFGKIVMCASPETAAGTISSMWDLLVTKGFIMEENDAHNGVSLGYRAIVVCLNRMGSSGNSFTKSICLNLATAKDKQPVFTSVCKLWNASEKMECCVLKMMPVVMEHMFRCMTNSKMQQDGWHVIRTVEDALVEYLSCHLQADVQSGMKAIHIMIGYMLCPHPLLEEILARVSMRMMSCAGDGFQLMYSTLIMDVMYHALSLDSDGVLSPSLEQCIAVASASLSCASQSTVDGFVRHCIDAVPRGEATVDVYAFARLSLSLRVLHVSSLRSTKGSSIGFGKNVEDLAQKVVQSIASVTKAFSLTRQPSEDEVLLLVWMVDCVYWTSTLESRPFGVRNGNMNRNNTLEACLNDLVSCVHQLSENSRNQKLLRAMILLERTALQKNLQQQQMMKSYGGAKRQGGAMLERFDPSTGAAAWLVQIASRQQQRPLGAMKKLFSGALDVHASPPLQHLGMLAYIEYIHYASEDNITSVLPRSKLHPQTGGLSEEFKKEVERYMCVIKNLPNPGEQTSSMEDVQLSVMMGDIWESLSQQCHVVYTSSAQPAPLASECVVLEDTSHSEEIHIALQSAKKSLRDLVTAVEGSANQHMPRAGMKRTLDDMQSDLTWLQGHV